MITEKDLRWAKKWVDEYTQKANLYEAMAKTCKPSQRGAYLSHAAKNRKNVERWKKHVELFTAQLESE